MSIPNGNQQSQNVNHIGDGAAQSAELAEISGPSPSSRPEKTTEEGSATHRRWRMPPKVPAVTPSRRHKRDVERRFQQADEAAGHQWKADSDEVYDYMAVCESAAEKLFLIDLVEEAGTHLEHVSTAWARPDGWYITISSPFHVQRKLGCAPWFRVYPQRPILMPDGLMDKRGTRPAPAGGLYSRVDFLAVVHVETPAENGKEASRQPVVIEIDGKGSHSGEQKTRRDYTRNHRFQRIGVPPYRYLASDVNDSGYDTGQKVLSDLWAQARQLTEQIE